jgi:S-adenosylmethionine/arginine decarboxylase-like enzyme
MAHESVVQPTVFYRCGKNGRLMVGKPKAFAELKANIDSIVTKAGLTLFGSSIERYSDEEHHGFTYLAWIGESAIDIHTWPEHQSVVVNAHVCNLEKRNEDKVQKLFKLFKTFFGAKDQGVYEPIKIPLERPDF